MEKLEPHFEEVESTSELEIDPKKERAEKILSLVEKISESGESLPFPGIYPEVYSKIKNDDDEYPGYTTPIDEIIERCKNEGIKVVLGKHSGSGNIFVLPTGSNNFDMDGLDPRQLIIDNIENEHLRELILLTSISLRK